MIIARLSSSINNRIFLIFVIGTKLYQRNYMKSILFLQNIGAGEIIILALVVLLLFGGKKIPELMKGIGKGVRSFKEGVNEIEKDIDNAGEPQKKEDNK